MHARGYRGPNQPGAQAHPGARSKLNGDFPRTAPYVRPLQQPHWHVAPRHEVRPCQYSPQPRPQRLPQVPQRQLQYGPVLGPNGALGAFNFSFQPTGLLAPTPYDAAPHALGQADSRQVVGRTSYAFDRRVMSNERGHAPAYALPMSLPGPGLALRMLPLSESGQRVHWRDPFMCPRRRCLCQRDYARHLGRQQPVGH